ncbi:MAG: winged helix-turn-helix transcriptional regulator, partial [Bacilli bacterium]
RLEIKGLITRKRQEGDLRKKELIATEKAFVVEEKMKEHMIKTTEAFFEGISEEALESFQDTLGKIETNIEKERKMMHNKRRFVKQVLDLIEENKAITRENLADLLGKKGNKISRVVDKLINEGFIEEKDGQLSLTQKAIDHKQHHEMDRKDHRKGHPGDKEGRPGYREAPPEHKAVIKMILDNQGIMKADLIEKSVMDAYEIEDLLNHLTREGILEIKDDKIYADKEQFKGRHRH